MDSEWIFEGWFYRLDVALLGPVPTEQIKQLVSSSQLIGTARVWKRWRKGSETMMFTTIAKTAFDTQIVAGTRPPVEASAPAAQDSEWQL